MEKRCYTVQELQEILKINRKSVYALLKTREFSWVKLCGKYRISARSFDEWLDGRGKTADDSDENGSQSAS